MWFIEMRRKEAIKADQQSHQRTPSEPAFRTAEGGTRTRVSEEISDAHENEKDRKLTRWSCLLCHG